VVLHTVQVLSFMRPDFKQHLRKKLEYLGDASMNAQRLDSAIAEYSAALSLDPPISQNLFIRRSKAYIARGLWKDALNDANKVRFFVSCRFILVDSIIIRRSRSIHPLHGDMRGSTQRYTWQDGMTMPWARSRRCSRRYHSRRIQKFVVSTLALC